MIKFINVTKQFPTGTIALSEVNTTIDKNEFVFLIGPSGAGKSTFINLILNRFNPTSGEIQVDDIKITPDFKKDPAILRRKIGIVFQDFKLINTKNVYENIQLALEIINYPKDQIPLEIGKVLKFVELEGKERFFPLQLSAGEQQRVAIARAIAGGRKIILADEPTGNLDPKTSWKIMKIFAKLKGKRTIIIATHNMDIVNSWQERVIKLDKGKIVSDQKEASYNPS